MGHDLLMAIAVQAVLTPDLLREPYRSEYTPTNPTAGHCYIAAEALWHLLGGPASGYKPMTARDPDGGTHWWLQDAQGEPLDPTAAQYLTDGLQPPYHLGRGCGFLTRQPSKRAAIVIARVHAL